MKQLQLIFSLVLVFSMVMTALAVPAKKDLVSPYVRITGMEDTAFPEDYQGVRGLPYNLDEGTPGSVYETIGQSWYDYQHNGTAGKMVAVDPMNNVHFAWTHADNAAATNRHVYYNAVIAGGGGFSNPPAGVQVDASSRAGFVTVAVNNEGFAFPTFHQITATNPHSAVALDFLPMSGAFTVFQMTPLAGDLQIIWPKVAIDVNQDLHILSSENVGAGEEYYTHAHPVFSDGFGDHIEFVGDELMPWMDDAFFISIDVACSWHSNRIAAAWNSGTDTDNTGENVRMSVSEDAGLNWGPIVEVTNCPPVDVNCVDVGGDPAVCNGDTFRPWEDLSITFDNNDYVHVAFTGHGWFYFDSTGAVGPNGFVYSTIWHWGEDYNEFNIINEAWFAHDSVSLGINNLMCHRPSLAIDTTSGNLYCSFQQFDQQQMSETGFPQGDAWISVSETNGRTWSQATNVTGTDGGIGTPAGQCQSERDITLAQFVTQDTLHLFYQMDLDAGSAVIATPEGVPTLNDMIYQRIPVQDIPARPLINPYRAFHADSTGYPFDLDTTSAIGDMPDLMPESFTLYQNYPNPFNPTTRIRFDLNREEAVSLMVFDITGREVARLMDRERLSAGTHAVDFDGTAMASGVYFYRLDTQVGHETRKMMLVK